MAPTQKFNWKEAWIAGLAVFITVSVGAIINMVLNPKPALQPMPKFEVIDQMDSMLKQQNIDLEDTSEIVLPDPAIFNRDWSVKPAKPE